MYTFGQDIAKHYFSLTQLYVCYTVVRMLHNCTYVTHLYVCYTVVRMLHSCTYVTCLMGGHICIYIFDMMGIQVLHRNSSVICFHRLYSTK